MSETIIDHAGTSHQVPDDVFNDGPDDDDRDEFRSKTPAEKLTAWQTWAQDPQNDLTALLTARAQEARSRPRVPVGSNYRNLPPRRVPVDRAPSSANYQQIEFVEVDAAHFELSPGEYFDDDPDPNWDTMTDLQREQAWGTALKTRIYIGDVPKAQQQARGFFDGEDNVPADSGRRLDAVKSALRNNPKKSWALLAFLVSGVIAAIATPLALLLGRKLRTRVHWAAMSKSIVVVEWDAFDAVTDDGAAHVVTLRDAEGAVVTATTTDRATTAAQLLDVADGTYGLDVSLQRMGAELARASTTVEVRAPATAPTAAPGSPSAVTLAVTAAAPMATAGLTVTWTPAVAADPAVWFEVSLAGTAPVVAAKTVRSALPTVAFPVTSTGAYQATVVARNAAGASAGVASAIVNFSGTITAPNPPRNVRAMPYLSKSGKAALLVRWDAPLDGVAVVGYRVELALAGASQNPNPVVTSTPASVSARFDDLADGSYTFTVASRGMSADSAAVAGAQPITLAAATIDADTIEWDVVFSPDDVATWKAANDQLSAADEATFWKKVTAAVEDTAGDYGGIATYGEQLALAKVLVGWITTPAAMPDQTRLDNLADRLAASTTPPFPTRPPAMGQAPYADRLALWKAAATLQNAMGTTDEVRRYKLFAIIGALGRYLAPAPLHDRLYENDVVPAATRTVDPTNAMTLGGIVTGQRVEVLADGLVHGVWWYRTPGDTGVNTATVRRAGTVLATAQGDPGTTGWVSLSFATAVQVAAGDQLIVAVHRTRGYAVRERGLTAGPRTSTLGHLRLPQSRPPAAGNGIYAYGGPTAAPNLTYLDSEYFVTPDFTAT